MSLRLNARALERRMAKVEKARQPKRSPFVLWYGSFDAWVEKEVLPFLESGALDPEFILIVAALRKWESNGTWDKAYANAG